MIYGGLRSIPKEQLETAQESVLGKRLNPPASMDELYQFAELLTIKHPAPSLRHSKQPNYTELDEENTMEKDLNQSGSKDVSKKSKQPFDELAMVTYFMTEGISKEIQAHPTVEAWRASMRTLILKTLKDPATASYSKDSMQLFEEGVMPVIFPDLNAHAESEIRKNMWPRMTSKLHIMTRVHLIVKNNPSDNELSRHAFEINQQILRPAFSAAQIEYQPELVDNQYIAKLANYLLQDAILNGVADIMHPGKFYIAPDIHGVCIRLG